MADAVEVDAPHRLQPGIQGRRADVRLRADQEECPLQLGTDQIRGRPPVLAPPVVRLADLLPGIGSDANAECHALALELVEERQPVEKVAAVGLLRLEAPALGFAAGARAPQAAVSAILAA